MIRKLFLAVALASVMPGFVPGFASAQPNQKNPSYDTWCRHQGISRGSTMICWAFTYEQCMASRTSHTESCFLNPKYDPRFAEWRKRNPHY